MSTLTPKVTAGERTWGAGGIGKGGFSGVAEQKIGGFVD